MKPFFHNLWDYFRPRWGRINQVILFVALIVQFQSLMPLLSHFMDHRAIIEAHDNDAGKMVEVAENSRWYNDNYFRYYGPLYFRIVNTFDFISPTNSGRYDLSTRESKEESLHFYLLFTSVLGVYLIALCCSFLVSNRWDYRMLFLLFFVPILLYHPIWLQFLFTAHPDFLLMGLCALSTLLTIRMLQSHLASEHVKWAAYSWGLALSTKLSSLFFMPGIGILLFLYTKNKSALWQKCKEFLKYACISYFVIGFPQNLDIGGSLKKLFKLSEFSAGFTLDSFINWWGYFGSQSVYPLLFILGFYLFFGNTKRKTEDFRINFLSFLFLNLGLFIITTRTLELVHYYYVMPFVAAFLISTFLLLEYLPNNFFEKILTSETAQRLTITAIILIAAYLQLFSFQEAKAMQRKMLTCRPTYQSTYNLIQEQLAAGAKIIATPYTPVPIDENSNVDIDWELNFDTVQKNMPQLLVFNNGYYARYTESADPSNYVKINNPDWQKTREFYLSFEKKNDVNLNVIGHWKKISEDRCSLEIWQKQ